MLHRSKKDSIAKAFNAVLQNRTLLFPTESTFKRNEPFHRVLYHAFEAQLQTRSQDVTSILQVSSWVQGVNTSMGSFFERVACILSGGKKMAFTTKKKTSLKISDTQTTKIKQIWNKPKSGNTSPNEESEIAEILSASSLKMQEAADFTVDVFWETHDSITAIELKSVRPNKGESAGEKQKMLEAKIALHNSFPDKKILYFIGFPFDPTNPTPLGYDKKRFMQYLIGGGNYFAPEEFMLGSELWDFLSGEKNTMRQILAIMENVVGNRAR
ncbi:TdeIII family type II restriction endonuclease [Candidatus Peregrinibacteria bacterium]|nr:TdeIII family type II restriction endonuclease [Candidatus Peregrinibacteria bacterium]